MNLDVLNGFDYGIVSFFDYQKYRKVKNKDWIKSIIVFVFPYAGKDAAIDGYLTAKYAYGKDYHLVIKAKLEELAEKLKLSRYEVMTDISYLDEKLCAVLAGLGKIGKNNLLLTPKYGSRILIGEIVTSEELPITTKELENPCIDCYLCIKKCPTQALSEGFNKKQCLSFLSQTRGNTFDLYDKMELVVGCDICQDVCPLNRREQAYPKEFCFDIKSRFLLEEFEKLDEESFKEYYQDKAFGFLGFKRLLRNLLVLETNNKKLSLEALEKYENLIDEEWFRNHLEYLKGRIKNG
ncbi:MAG TPA: epoxyqueuosine reductase [Acholeplasmataceae bacterium]|jgi:epoxyqueuosine reductase|nr:epoxyqueuosine reductase [Acholeplasmataceae bacterium]